MFILARTAVPVAAAGLLLTACGGGGSHPPVLDAAAPAATLAGAPANLKAAAPGATHATAPVTLDTAPMAPHGSTPAGPAPTVAVGNSTITTRGVGKASGTPDTLTVVIGVSTQGSSAKAALEANNSKAKALIDLLRNNGVADKDLQTSQLSINPTYDDKSGKISGYQVDNTVQATMRSIASAGSLLDAAAGVVGNAVRVQQVRFSVGDDSALRSQARAQAVLQAKAQAAQIAKAAGVTLGRIRSITELPDSGSPVYYEARSPAASADSVPIQAGQQDVTVSVDIVYELR